MFRWLSGLMMCAVGASATAQAQTPRPGVAWYTAGSVQLAITEPRVGLSAQWQFDQADNGDTRVIKNEERMGTRINGTVLSICDDRALLLRGITPGNNGASTELDGPIHMLQLALRLLERGVPQGPQALTGEIAVDVSDNENPIRVKGISSTVEFLAPWRVRGKVAHVASGQNTLDLVYSYSTAAAQGKRFEMSMVGVWNARGAMPVFPDDMPVDGWTVYRVTQGARQVGGTFVIEKSVTRQPVRFATLGQLRAHVERGWNLRGRPIPDLACRT